MSFLELGLTFVSTVKPNSRKDTMFLINSKQDLFHSPNRCVFSLEERDDREPKMAPSVWGETFFAFAPTYPRAPCLCRRLQNRQLERNLTQAQVGAIVGVSGFRDTKIEKPETVWPETSLTTLRLTRRAGDEDRRNPGRAQRGHHRNCWI